MPPVERRSPSDSRFTRIRSLSIFTGNLSAREDANGAGPLGCVGLAPRVALFDRFDRFDRLDGVGPVGGGLGGGFVAHGARRYRGGRIGRQRVSHERGGR
jgi:hypothetical protein